MALKQNLNDVLVFTEVARLRSFTAAGEQLGLPASAVSRRVRRLETHLGFRLLHRTTRRVGLTDAGRIYYDRIAAMPRMIAEAERAVTLSLNAPSGTLRIAAPPEDRGVIWGVLGPFVRDHPQVDLQIVHTLTYVDLIKEDIDVALRGGAPPDSTDVVAKLLWDSRILLAASPDYLAIAGVPTRAEDLADHDGVCMDPWAPNAIRRLDGDLGFVRVTMRNRVRANSLETARRAALAGLGIAPLLQLTCQEDLDQGTLVEVLRGALPDSAKGYYVYPVHRERSAAAQALLDYLARLAKVNLGGRGWLRRGPIQGWTILGNSGARERQKGRSPYAVGEPDLSGWGARPAPPINKKGLGRVLSGLVRTWFSPLRRDRSKHGQRWIVPVARHEPLRRCLHVAPQPVYCSGLFGTGYVSDISCGTSRAPAQMRASWAE